MLLTIDGVQFDIKAKLKRVADVRESDISGQMADKSYFSDVYGTYLTYQLSLTYPLYDQGVYARLYELLTAPLGNHTFILPYNGQSVTINGKVSTATDDYEEREGGRHKYWRDLNVTIAANNPTKTTTLGEVISMGRPAMPEDMDASEGDTYVWHNGAWVFTEYPDADEIYF